MRNSIVYMLSFICAFITLPAMAQEAMPENVPPAMAEQLEKFQAMSPEEQQAYVQQMMAGANRMQECINEVGGESGMQDLQSRGDAAQAEIKTLCMEGDREKAQEKALENSREMMKDPRVQKLQACAKEAATVMPGMETLLDYESYLAENHVCDLMGEQP